MKKNIDKFLAKDNGDTLLNHLTNVGLMGKIMGCHVLPENSNLIPIIEYSGLLHDIGKATIQFQKKLCGQSRSKNKVMHRHNEIGWAFIRTYFRDSEIIDLMSDAVYFHHGVTDGRKHVAKYKTSIIESISDEDMSNMKLILEKLCPGMCLSEENKRIDNNDITPRYFHEKRDDSGKIDNLNAQHMLIRSCLISADRKISSLSETKPNIIFTEIALKREINRDFNRQSFSDKIILDEIESPYDDDMRFTDQKDIVRQTDGYKTAIIKATGGYGKSMIGLLWALRHNEKVIWVCPRNTVARTVYLSILKELNALKISVSVELYLSGEVKMHTDDTMSDFGSDIIITNIDNYLTPTFQSKNSYSLYLIHSARVIFDEYHELIGEPKLFALFIIMMRARHRFSKSKTLLLSATYLPIENLWDTITNSTIILPNRNGHYGAQHNQTYILNVQKECILPNNNDLTIGNNLIVFNSVTATQQYAIKLRDNGVENLELMHGKFQTNRKDEKLTSILDEFGKDSERITGKNNWVGTHILQAAIDISFHKLYESCISPMATTQRVARIDRYGDIISDTPCEINIFWSSDFEPSERKVREELFNTNLAKKWFDYMQTKSGMVIILNDLYQFYNQFLKDFAGEFQTLIRNNYYEGLDGLKDIYPIKYTSMVQTSDMKIYSVNSNRLRASGNEIFSIYKISESDQYTEPFNIKIYNDIRTDFKEAELGNVARKINIVYKSLRARNDMRYDWEAILKFEESNDIEELRKLGRYSNTPYVGFNKEYNEFLGLIDIER